MRRRFSRGRRRRSFGRRPMRRVGSFKRRRRSRSVRPLRIGYRF